MIHILNGDALLEMFPKQIDGKKIVMRECLIDGDIEGDTLDEFASTRDRYLSNTYPEVTEIDYSTHVLPELKSIESIPEGEEIVLWFEDDLFCQVNLWFVCHLIPKGNQLNSVYLVRPEKLTQWGFAAYSEDELKELFEKKIPLKPEQLSYFDDLWLAYKTGNVEQVLEASGKLNSEFPWISVPVNALENLVNDQKPQRFIEDFVSDNPASSFGDLFQALTKEMPEYGFGDLQVKKMYGELI